MLLEFGSMALLITASLLLLFTRFNVYWQRKVLENPLFADLVIFVTIFWLHTGTFAGGLIAALAAFFASILLTFGRWWYRITPIKQKVKAGTATA